MLEARGDRVVSPIYKGNSRVYFMATRIRLARGGTKKRPYYRIVVTDSRSPRDGKFIEKLGTYNPLLAKDDADRLRLVKDRIEHWIGTGAQPSDRVAKMLQASGIAIPAGTTKRLAAKKASGKVAGEKKAKKAS